jgi:ubiquinone/menaquinone biosynthesis C-methylase UbiE
VLELGCGTGKNTVWLAERAKHVVAMDLSRGMLDIARARVSSDRVSFVRADIRRQWCVRDASFDFVIANLILEHVERVGPIFTEAARVLCDGGRLFLCELHPARQLRGGQAHFDDRSTGETIYVQAYTHSVSEYLNGGIDAELTAERVGEWRSDADAGGPPRLFSAQFRKSLR